MISKTTLEAVIASWPNDEGISSDLETYQKWVDTQWLHLSRLLRLVLGHERIKTLSDRQLHLLEQSFERLFQEKSIFEITDEEILGKYELITEHISPKSMEMAVQHYKARKRSMN